MKARHKKIFELAKPYLRKGIRKNTLLHTFAVVRAMQLILKGEGGDDDILIPAAILHDVGWASVPRKIQIAWRDEEKRIEGEKLHIKLAAPIVKRILNQAGYKEDVIDQIDQIVSSHKFCDPEEKNKQLLIDADNLSDCFYKQFYDNVRNYNVASIDTWNFRIKQTDGFYTRTAKKIFVEEMAKRKKEIISKI